MKKMYRVLALVMICLVGIIAVGGTAATKAEKPANRLETILNRGYIEVATEPYFAPNEFIDTSKAESGEVVGSDVLLAQRIAERLGVELRLVPLDFSAVLASVTEGKYDLAISALAWTPARAENMEMSKGYYYGTRGNYTVLVRSGDADQYTGMESLNGKRVVCQAGSLQQALILNAVEEFNLDIELSYVSATTDGYMMVDYGKADAAVCASSNGQLYAEANGSLSVMGDVIDFKVSDDYLGTRIGAPKGETELMDFVNGVIDEILDSHEYEDWYDYYTEYAKTLGL